MQQETNFTNNKNLIAPKCSKKFLFAGNESLSGDLAWQIKKEGHEAKVYIKSEQDKDVYISDKH